MARLSDEDIKELSLQKIVGVLSRISKFADNPTTWQRLEPDVQADMMNMYRRVLHIKRSPEWPLRTYNMSDISRSLEANYQRNYATHEHLAPPTTLHHYHQQVPVVVDANAPLVRGQPVSYTHLTLPTKA